MPTSRLWCKRPWRRTNLRRQLPCGHWWSRRHNRQAKLDMSLLKKLVRGTEVLKADSGSNEVLSVKMMRNLTFEVEGNKLCFRNVTIARDKAHGARRTLGRTWDCDPFLSEVFDKFVSGSDSLVQKVQHSRLLEDMFARACEEVDNGPHVSLLMFMHASSIEADEV